MGQAGGGDEVRIPPEVVSAHARFGSEMITVMEPWGVPRYESPEIRRTLGYRPIEHFDGDAGGGSWTGLIHPEDVAKMSESVEESIAAPGEHPPVEYRIKDAAGEWRWFESRGVNLADDPEIRGIVVSTREISDRKRAEERLAESERRFRAMTENSTEAVEIVSTDGTLLYASPGFGRLYGYDPEEAVSRGMNVLDYVHPEDLARVGEDTNQALAEREAGRTEGHAQTHTTEYRFLCADGTYRWKEGTATYLLDDPAVGGVLVNARDIAGRKEAERRLREEKDLLRDIIDAVPDHVFLKDRRHRFLLNNAGHLRALGAESQEAALGKTNADFGPPEIADKFHADDERVMSSGEAVLSEEEPFVDAGGEEIWFSTTKVPLRSPEGEVWGLVGISRDITERLRAEETLREVEARRDSAIENAPLGISLIGLDGRFLSANPAARQILGYTEEDLLGQNVREITHPDDLAKHRERTERLYSGEGPDKERLEKRFLRADGSPVWILCDLHLVRDAEGQPDHFVSQISDLTERKALEEALAESEARFRGAFEGAPIGVALVGTDSRFLKVNPALCELFGHVEEELLSMTSYEVTHPDDHAASREWMARQERPDAQRDTIEMRFVRGNGEVMWASVGASLVRDAAGETGHWVCHYQDVTERRRLQERLEHRATHDPLTDLPNRSLFTDRLEEALDSTGTGPVSVLFIDLDDFKEVNDSFGHAVGDELLVAVAGRLGGCLRPGDTICRLGGDEFVALLADTAPDEAAEVAARVRARIAEPFSLSGAADRRLGASASVGIACSGDPGTAPEDRSRPEAEDLLRVADRAMYEAKHGGRYNHRRP